jgi:hypothetical protein
VYALDDSVWGMKITALEESADFATLDIEKLFSKLKSHELSRKGHPNHYASLTSKTFVTCTHVGGHVANPTNTTDSSAFEFALSSLCSAFDEQYESILDDEIALLARKFRALHRFRKERRRSPRGCFECGNTSHFIANCPKRKKFDSSNKYNYNNRNNGTSYPRKLKSHKVAPRELYKQEASTLTVSGWRPRVLKGFANEGCEEIWGEREAITLLYWTIPNS